MDNAKRHLLSVHAMLVSVETKSKRGYLTYRLTRCPLCGFEALHPNGFYTAHVRVLNGVEMPTVIDLHKQRWRCHNCYHTVS
ncbi:transposase family protein, partial [Lacticaseibacillus paracasei]|uniref:transposase family protein n=1 Tax=Lacticaseibacillus paracasei TaxID=1597 RepID=UPI0030F40AEA